jgi:hypothetical protein
MYLDTIVDGRAPTRKVVLLSNLKAELRTWIPITNVYRSIYSFSRLDKDGRPDWSSAVLDTIYLDVDIMNSEGKLHDENLMPRIIKWLNEKDYKRTYLFTGGGYGISIDVADATKERIYTAHYYLRGELDFNIDKAAIDLARGKRMVPSYNFHKKSFVSYVTEQEAGFPFMEVFKKFQHPGSVQVVPTIYGAKPWSLLDVKSRGKQYTASDPGPLNDARNEVGIVDIEKKYGKVCDTVIKLARQDHVTHQERFFLILYLKDVMNVPYSEITTVFHALIGDKRDFQHSIAEQQARYAYSAHTKFNPKIFKMFGYCPGSCSACTDMIDENSSIIEGVLM